MAKLGQFAGHNLRMAAGALAVYAGQEVPVGSARAGAGEEWGSGSFSVGAAEDGRGGCIGE
eukprot:6513107-Pyramimonas_sp.AAC.1